MPQIEVPTLVTDIPDNLSPGEMQHWRAQVAIQSIFHATGDKDIKPGTATMTDRDLEQSLELALAMMLAADPRIATPEDIRANAEAAGKRIGNMVEMFRRHGDTTATQLMGALGIARSKLD